MAPACRGSVGAGGGRLGDCVVWPGGVGGAVIRGSLVRGARLRAVGRASRGGGRGPGG